MRRTIGVALVALLLGGCAVYAEPVAYGGPPPASVFVAPAPVVVAPVYPWGWHAGWRGGWRHHGEPHDEGGIEAGGPASSGASTEAGRAELRCGGRRETRNTTRARSSASHVRRRRAAAPAPVTAAGQPAKTGEPGAERDSWTSKHSFVRGVAVA